MLRNKYKGKNISQSIEKHDTAAWANIEKTKSISQVTIPSELQIDNAKDYVDENEK